MHPETTGRRDEEHDGNQQAAAMRKYTSSHRATTLASMSTEYQAKFLPPHCHMTVVSTTTQKKPYHSLKGTSADITTFRSYYVTNKWSKHPPKPPQPKASHPTKVHQRCRSTPHDPARLLVNQLASKLDGYTSVYKNDYRAWTADKQQAGRVSDSLKANAASVEGNAEPAPHKKEPHSFESITSYRSEYVTHPLPPRTHKPVNQTNKGLPLDPTAPFPKMAWDTPQEPFDGASEFLKNFNTWTLGNKFQSKGKAHVSSPAEDCTFLSTTHADYISHKCQRTKPILPAVNSTEKSKEPFQATTTMREDYKAWGAPRYVPVRKEEMERRTNPFSVRGPTPAQSCRLHSTKNETAVCSCSCDATEKPQSPAKNESFSGFQCISSGNNESRMYWSTCVNRGATSPDGDNCKEPSQAHQIISCMVSSRRC